LKEIVEKLQREYDDLDEHINENNMKFESVSKSVSDTSSIAKVKGVIQKLNVIC
jgi:cell division protein FtsL